MPVGGQIWTQVVVAVGDLRRAPMRTPVVGDHSVGVAEEGVPVAGRQRPPVTEDDRLAAPPSLQRIFVPSAVVAVPICCLRWSGGRQRKSPAA